MGAIRDVTNSFDIPFIIGGLSFITSALMHFVLMWIAHQEKAKMKEVKDENNMEIIAGALDV